MSTHLYIRPYGLDMRTAEQVMQGAAIRQEIEDQRLEQLWRDRVAANERARFEKRINQQERSK